MWRRGVRMVRSMGHRERSGGETGTCGVREAFGTAKGAGSRGNGSRALSAAARVWPALSVEREAKLAGLAARREADLGQGLLGAAVVLVQLVDVAGFLASGDGAAEFAGDAD